MKLIRIITLLTLALSSQVTLAQKASILSASIGYNGWGGDFVDFAESYGVDISGGVTYGVDYVALQQKGLGFGIGYHSLRYNSQLEDVKGETDWNSIVLSALYGLGGDNDRTFPYIGVEYHFVSASEFETSGCGDVPQACQSFDLSGTGSSYGLVLGSYVLGEKKDDLTYGFGIRAITSSDDYYIYQGFFNIGMSF